MAYYDGTKLLSLMDINGQRPEIYIATSNRTGGKSTYFGRLLVNRFKKRQEKFMLLYRWSYELDDCANKFFKDIGSLFFPGAEMTNKRFSKGVYHELYLDEVPCGYAVAVNNADAIKKQSHLFSDVGCMMLDEFQSETGHYCPNEVSKLISIHTSVARGQGEQTRYVPLYLVGNPVSMINPYYTALGISSRLDNKTKFLRGDGFVMEQGYVQSAADALVSSGFSRAFAKSDYIAYSAQGVYLNDSLAFIERPAGSGRYLGTLIYKGANYGIRSFDNDGIIYVDDKPDADYPHKIAVTTQDHNINYVTLRANYTFIQQLKYYFDRGALRFRNLQCKDCILAALSV